MAIPALEMATLETQSTMDISSAVVAQPQAQQV
jgi:hypothetical protein